MGIPYLALQSTASRLAISAVGSELETRFYGDYEQDVDRSIDYLSGKVLAALRGWQAVDAPPAFIGVVLTLNLPFTVEDGEPARYIAERHLRQEVDASALQDAVARISVRVDETYFLTLAISNYETRAYDRPVFSGQQLLQVRPWEGTVEGRGIELTIDVNNKLALINREGDFTVDESTVASTLAMLKRAIQTAPTGFVENASLDLESLVHEEA